MKYQFLTSKQLYVTGFFQSHAVEVEVKDSSNATCIYAKWMMSFFIKYETNSSEYVSILELIALVIAEDELLKLSLFCQC